MKTRPLLTLLSVLALYASHIPECRAQGIEITQGATIQFTSNATIELNNQGFIIHGSYVKGSETIIFSGVLPSALSGTKIADIHNLNITNTGGITTRLEMLKVSDLTITSGSCFTIHAGKLVNVTNTLINNAGNNGLILKSSSNTGRGTAHLDNATPGVSATVERFVSGDLWHLIGPAATGGETVAEFVGTTQNANLIARNSVNFGLASFIENKDSWEYYKVSGSNTNDKFGVPGKGYQILRAAGAGTGQGSTSDDGAVSFKGTLGAGDLSIAIAQTGSGWNLIGNPYPCGLDVIAFLTENTSSFDESFSAIYVSDSEDVSTFGYRPLNRSSNTILSPGEGFFVKSAYGCNTVKFTASMKILGSDDEKTGSVLNCGFVLTAESGGARMNAQVKFIQGMTNGLDPGWDAGMFEGAHPSIRLSTSLVQDNGVDFAIQCLPQLSGDSVIVPVGLSAARGSKVTLRITDINLPPDYWVSLEDRLTQSRVPMDGDGSGYTLTIESSQVGTDRLFLHVTPVEMADPVYTEMRIVPLRELNILRIFGQVPFPARVSVFDLSGRIVATRMITTSDQQDFPLQGLKRGIYLFRIDAGPESRTGKFTW